MKDVYIGWIKQAGAVLYISMQGHIISAELNKSSSPTVKEGKLTKVNIQPAAYNSCLSIPNTVGTIPKTYTQIPPYELASVFRNLL